MGRGLARRWRMVAASVAGTSHRGSGRPCADACDVRSVFRARGGSLLIAAVADGAGSSAHADEGARIACKTIVDRAAAWARTKGRAAGEVSNLTRTDALEWVEAVRERIANEASSRRLACHDFSCTLLVTLVDQAAAVFFQVGDGAIVYRGKGEAYLPALWPQSGEYANCTWFVTDRDADKRLEWATARGVHEVAILSDGLQALALRFASREAHAPFFEPMFAALRRAPPGRSERLEEAMVAFLGSPPVNRRTDDDKTLVLATRLPADPASPTYAAATEA
jgi:Protein phosphatase 2C